MAMMNAQTTADVDACGVGGAIVLFAKCPIPGASKTRLSPLLGHEGSALLAKGMLSDVIITISESVRVQLFLLPRPQFK